MRCRRRGLNAFAIRVTLVLFPVLVAAQPSLAAVNLVQSKTGITDNGLSVSAIFDTPPTEGNLLVAIAGNYNGSASPTLPPGWSTARYGPSHTPGQSIYYKIAGSSEPSTITISDYPLGFDTRLGLHIYEYSGIDTADPLDVTNMADGYGTSISPGDVTTTNAEILIIVGFITNVSTSATGWSNSFIEQNDFRNGGNPSSQATYAGAHLIVSSQGTYTTTATTGANGNWRAQIAAFNVLSDPNTLAVDTDTDVLDGDTTSISNLMSDKGADGFISLREAIIACNNTVGLDTIRFNIAGPGPHSIQPTTELPTITDAIYLDGYSQPGASPSTQAFPNAMDAVLKIEINGTQLAGTGADGLRVSSGTSTIRGLAINNFTGSNAFGIYLFTNGGNRLLGNFIGTDLSGTAAMGNDGYAVYLSGANNIVGGSTAGEGNIISGNNNYGIRISGNGNRLEGNFIGSDITGAQNLGNGASGVGVFSGMNTIIGGSAAGAGNLISGNGTNGIWFNSSPDTCVVQGNRIGTDISGTLKIGNASSGVLVNCPNVTVGGTIAGAGNLISGNGNGIRISSLATNTVVQGNHIGTMVGGTGDLGNLSTGVQISTGGNLIGETTGVGRNVISANAASGILITGAEATGNLIQGNFIGTDITGSIDLGNGQDGILIDGGSSDNTIGGTAIGARNVISGNNSDGVDIADSGTHGNKILGNYIGTDSTGTLDLGNAVAGVRPDGQNDTIGGTAPGSRNIISGNNTAGVIFSSAGSAGNVLAGNWIGTDSAGTTSLANQYGIWVAAGSNNVIGGTATGAGNVIAGSVLSGIYFSGAATTGHRVEGNFIGTDTSGTLNLGNGSAGILFLSGANNNIVGGKSPDEQNLIAFNGGDGIWMNDGAGAGNAILGNAIYANAAIGIDLGNDNVTANDAGDIDTGPNNIQNYPVLDSAITNSTDTIVIYGTLNSRPDSVFRIEFFASDSADGTGYGEGEVFLGDTTVNTDGSGNVSFSTTLAAGVTAGQVIAVTATDANNNTSEFSDTVLAVNAVALSVAVSNSIFGFGVTPLSQWLTADSSFVVNDGSVAENFVAQISTFTDGSSNWDVSNAANGADSIRAQWSTTSATGPWTDISAYDSDFTIATNVTVSDTVTFYFRIQTPTGTSSYNEYSSTLTVTAQEF